MLDPFHIPQTQRFPLRSPHLCVSLESSHHPVARRFPWTITFRNPIPQSIRAAAWMIRANRVVILFVRAH
jgi:hypothetical protein